jgi:hypothetical protein
MQDEADVGVPGIRGVLYMLLRSLLRCKDLSNVPAGVVGVGPLGICCVCCRRVHVLLLAFHQVAAAA